MVRTVPASGSDGARQTRYGRPAEWVRVSGGLDANTVVAAVATVVALAALGFTIQQTRLTRAHNRLSVQPVLDFTESFRPGERAGLRLRNVGLGPARIVSGEVWLDGRRRGEPLGKR